MRHNHAQIRHYNESNGRQASDYHHRDYMPRTMAERRSRFAMRKLMTDTMEQMTGGYPTLFCSQSIHRCTGVFDRSQMYSGNSKPHDMSCSLEASRVNLRKVTLRQDEASCQFTEGMKFVSQLQQKVPVCV